MWLTIITSFTIDVMAFLAVCAFWIVLGIGIFISIKEIIRILQKRKETVKKENSRELTLNFYRVDRNQ